MASTGSSGGGCPHRRTRPARRLARALVWLGAVAAPAALAGQGQTVIGVRGGAGIGGEEHPVFGGQIELTDLDRSTAVEVAVHAFGQVHTSDRYQITDLTRAFDYREDLDLWGIGVSANYLLRHSRQTRGPYFLVGLGLAALWFDWVLETTNPRVGVPLPTGGSSLAERRMMLGSQLNFGIGKRLGDHFDVRAQLMGVILPGTELREDLELVPVLTLTSGITL